VESGQIGVIASGFAIGIAFGAIVQRTNYCIMGAVADYAISGDLRRMRAWMLAIAVAIVGTQALHLGAAVDLHQAFFRAPLLPLGGLVLGGLAFGFGMVIACGCSSRSLVNAAGGDLRALVTLIVMGLTGYMTVRGLLAPARIWLNEASGLNLASIGLSDSGLGSVLAASSGLSEHAATVAALLATALPLAVFALGDAGFRRQRRYLIASVSLGLLIGSGWFVTGVLGADDFEPHPLLSLRFVAPIGDSLQYLMLFTGIQVSFGVATVGGVLTGAFAASIASGSFRLRGFEDVQETGRYLAGGALMGVGGVLSMGCTVGQGMSGVSTLAVGSFIAVAAIICGGILGIRYLEQGSFTGALRAVARRA